mmetsp:Transcript_20731/g.71629  ORF Transcript_20731/g.71629 Transcript_20731/m.71629 type:complete len:225 (-) Transcript_20731:68-742(-)
MSHELVVDAVLVGSQLFDLHQASTAGLALLQHQVIHARLPDEDATVGHPQVALARLPILVLKQVPHEHRVLVRPVLFPLDHHEGRLVQLEVVLTPQVDVHRHLAGVHGVLGLQHHPRRRHKSAAGAGSGSGHGGAHGCCCPSPHRARGPVLHRRGHGHRPRRHLLGHDGRDRRALPGGDLRGCEGGRPCRGAQQRHARDEREREGEGLGLLGGGHGVCPDTRAP